jgi:hypothetical protein
MKGRRRRWATMGLKGNAWRKKRRERERERESRKTAKLHLPF